MEMTDAFSVPFVITMVVALLISTYMLLDPAKWLYDLMGLTFISDNYKGFMLVLALGGFCCSYAAERFLFPQLAKLLGRLKQAMHPNEPKKRKQYKMIQDSMKF